jgi:hypothetical protein
LNQKNPVKWTLSESKEINDGAILEMREKNGQYRKVIQGKESSL